MDRTLGKLNRFSTAKFATLGLAVCAMVGIVAHQALIFANLKHSKWERM